MLFRSKTIIGIAIIETVLLGILVISGIRWLHDSNEAQFIQSADSLTRLFASNIKDALLASDLAKLETISSEVVTYPGLKYLRIINQNGLVLVKVGDENLLSKTFQADDDLSSLLDNVYDTSTDIIVEGIKFGRVELGLSVTEFQALMLEARNFGAGIAFLEIILVALFSYALGTYLTSQLSLLTRASERISAEGPGFKLPVRGNDELAQVTSAFNFMSESLATTYREVHESAENYRKISSRLAESDKTKSAILSASLDAVVTIDSNGKVHDFNDAAESMFGYKKEEIIGQDMAELLIPDKYREAHGKGMKHILETGETQVIGTRLELSAKKNNGNTFPIEISITQLDIKGKTLFTAFIRDITKQKLMDEELRLIASTFDSHEAIYITDIKSKILRVNKAFCKNSGYKEEEAINKTPFQLFGSGEHTENFYEQIWETVKNQGKWEGEIYNRNKNGEISPQWMSISSVLDKNGNAIHFVATSIDISEQKKQQTELLEARKLAEQANHAKSSFLANMSHEIRTPLNAIINLNALLMDTELDKKQKELVVGAYEGSKTLATLVDDILDYTKIESDKLVLEYKPFNVKRLIDQLVTFFSYQAKAKDLQFIVKVEEDLTDDVLGDEKRLRQVLVNLIGNAIKFTKNGYVKISVKKSIEKNILFEIEDTGIGIGKGDKSRLFEEFSQGDTSTTRKYGGTGLGLSISRRLVSLMKGTVECKNNEPVGSIFRIYIPLIPTKIPAATENIPHVGVPLDINVLVAEDSEANQMVIRVLLEKYGCKVIIAKNGREALKLAAGEKFDLILMDVMMPVMDGIEATRKIRKLGDTHNDVPIIALTANVFSEDRDKCLQAGMNDFIGKPIDQMKLKEKIIKWSSKKYLFSQRKSTMHTLELINTETLKKLGKETSPEFIPEIISIFVREMADRLNFIDKMQDELAAKELIASAHAIKSSAVTFGAMRLAEIARSMEQHARNDELTEARSMLGKVVGIGKKTIEAYKPYMAESEMS